MTGGLALAMGAAALGATASLQAEVAELEVGQTVSLYVNVAEGQALQPPQVNLGSGFVVRYDGANQSMSPGGLGSRRTMIRRYLYKVTAVAPGTWTAGPLEIPLRNDTVVTTNALELTVVPRRAAVVDFLAEASFDHVEVWEGQVVVYRYRLSSRPELMGLDWRLPAFDGLRRPLHGGERHREFSIAEKGGDLTVSESSLPLVATGTGDRSQPPAIGMVKVPSGRADVLGFRQYRSDTVPTTPAPLVVRPLPPPPTGFSGLVGDFEIRAELGRKVAVVGDSVPLEIRVSGDGTLEGFVPPTWDSADGFSVYEVDSESTAGVADAGGYEATGFYRRVVVPTQEGELVLPELAVLVFSPSAGAYRTLRAEVGTLEVSGGGQAADIESFELDRPAVGTPEEATPALEFRDNYRSGPATAVYLGPQLVAGTALAAAPGGLVIVGLALQRLQAARERRRRSRAPRPRTWADQLDSLPPGAGPLEAMLRRAANGARADEAEALLAVAEALHVARYRDSATTDLEARARALLRGLGGPVLAALLVVSSAGCGARLDEGARRFEAGDLPGAIASWEAAGPASDLSGRAHYDVANAHYRAGDLGRAIGHYRAAQRLRPRDGNIHHNLAMARNDAVGAPPPVARRPSWMSFVTVGELGALGLALTAAGSVLLVAARAGRGSVRTAAAIWGSGLAVGSAVAHGAWSLEHRAVVVVVEPAMVRGLPLTDSRTDQELAVGSEVLRIERQGPWALIEDGEGRRGWVAASALFDLWDGDDPAGAG